MMTMQYPSFLLDESLSLQLAREPNDLYPLEGGCDCKYIRYRMSSRPLIVHCCHCRWCQRETGSAFALNAMIEADRVIHIAAEPERIDSASESGSGQIIARCPRCKVAVWSDYNSPYLRFVRVGTLDNPDFLPPDVHIYTASKQPWLVLPQGKPTKDAYYLKEEVWSKDSLERLDKIRAKHRKVGNTKL